MACMGVGVEESLLFWVRIFFTDLKDHQAGVCVKAQTQASAASRLLWVFSRACNYLRID